MCIYWSCWEIFFLLLFSTTENKLPLQFTCKLIVCYEGQFLTFFLVTGMHKSGIQSSHHEFIQNLRSYYPGQHFHRYRTYRSNYNNLRAGFMCRLIQERLRATILSSQDGCRIANNTLDQHVFTSKPPTVIHQCYYSTACHFGCLLLTLV